MRWFRDREAGWALPPLLGRLSAAVLVSVLSLLLCEAKVVVVGEHRIPGAS